MHPFGPGAKLDNAAGIIPALHADKIKQAENIAHKKAKLLESAVRAVGNAAIDHDDRDAPRAHGADEVGPDFGFDEHKRKGPYGAQDPPDNPGRIHGKIEKYVVLFHEFFGHCPAGGSCDGKDKSESWPALAQLPRDAHCDEHLAYAHGMHPDPAPGAEFRAPVFRDPADSLEKALPVAAAAPHAQEPRQKQEIGKREDYVIDQPFHGRR